MAPEPVWTETTTRFIQNPETGHSEVYGVSRNITERRQAQEALRESEARLREFIHNAQSIAWIKDLDGRIINANRYVVELTNHSEEELKGTTSADSFSEEEARIIMEHDRQVIELGRAMQFEISRVR